MPIKFRCPHCEQFLGISRSKAGAVTDCPMCGRTIRVPQLDGTIVPLPKPTLNHGDSGLAKALDALASLGASDSTVEADEEITRPSKPEAIVLAPAPMIEAVLLPVPLPPEPLTPVGSNGGSSRPVPLRQDTARASNRARGPLDELAAMQLPSRQRASSPGDQKRQPLLVGVLCGVLGLAGGFWLGRVTGSSSPKETAPVVEKDPVIIPSGPVLPPTAEQGGAPASVSQTGDLKLAIEGRVTYVNAGGESRPESGARILAVPALHSGLTKLAVEGFRAGASAVDVRVAQASIRALGGDFALAGGDGHYEIQLPATGKYQLLIVSKYQGRPPGTEINPPEVEALKEWFDKPLQFFGQTQSTLATVQFDGQRSSIRDHVFPKAE